MSNDKDYTGKDIKVLTDREHVRLRTAVYLGNTSIAEFTLPDMVGGEFSTFTTTLVPAAYTAVGEILDNSTDEFAKINKKSKKLVITANSEEGQYTISDNGRGVPIDKHESGIHTPEVAFGLLRSGRNFEDGKEKGVKGMNGVGSAVTNFTCEYFNVTILRDKKKYEQSFKNGAETITPPSISTVRGTATGTTVDFKLDSTVYEQISIEDRVTRNRANYIALVNPGLVVEYNNETFHHPEGMRGYVKSNFTNYHEFEIKSEGVDGEIFVIYTDSKEDAQVFTWVNSSLLIDGGLCNTQFVNALVSQVTAKLERTSKRMKCQVTPSAVKQGLIILSVLKVTDPEYDSQAKVRLTGPCMRKEMSKTIEDGWTSLAKNHQEWLNQILERSATEFHSAEDKKAVKELENRIKRRAKPESLIEASSTKRQDCTLLVTEGLSARGSIAEARNPSTIAAFAMSGKFNNVYGCSIAQLIAMSKIADLLTVIGLVPGKKADRSKLRYGKVVIAVDADYDGQDIFTNFINLFFQFWPELLDPNEPPFIYKLIVPNVVAHKGNERIHFKARHEYEKVAAKYKTYDKTYMKGLGSMLLDDWEMVLASDSYLLPVVSDDDMADTMKLLFGHEAEDREMRKEWLENE